MPDPHAGRLEAVIYDVDGTMYRLRAMRARMAWQLAASLVVRPRKTWRAVKVLRAYRSAQERLRGPGGMVTPGRQGHGVCMATQTTRDHGTRPDDPQLRAAAEALGVPCEAIQPIVEEWMHRRPLRILRRCRRDVVLEAIRMLHGAGVRQAVYSDYPAQDKLAALGVAGCFDAIVWSAQAEVGQYKPSPEGFLRAAELLGVAPRRCAYVGDRADVDGAGARAAGMRYIDVTELKTPQSLTRRVECAIPHRA